jgi:YbbR domain-containing protein
VRNPLQFARDIVTRNFGWKLLSLALAFLIWILVASEPELSTFATARVEYRGLPQNLEISSEPVTTVSLELQGPPTELGRFGDGGTRPAVILDMSGVTVGQRTFPVGGGNVRVTRGVRLVRAIPSEIRYEFEPRMTKMVPVKINLEGAGAHGFTVGSAVADPAQIEITGPKSHVARVSAVTTDPVDVSAATGVVQVRVNAFVQDAFVRLISSPQVTVTVTVHRP